MTRYLSESLQAPEPFFRLSLKRLENMNGNPSSDIRLSTAVLHETQTKLTDLGLDPLNTTPKELYHVLNERVKADDKQLTRSLRFRAAEHVSAEADIVSGMVHALKTETQSRQCFAIKSARFKAILKKIPPKKAMKQLGYRSVDSFLKHESVASCLAAAWLTESGAWRNQLMEQYKHSKAADFETRSVLIFEPTAQKWRKLAEQSVEQNKHNILSFKELGAVVLLPLPSDVPPGVVTVSLGLAIHELNEVYADSTYLKLCQVHPNFNELFRNVINSEANLNSKLLYRSVPWHLIQRYYSRLSTELKTELFEPHINSDDMSWQAVEDALTRIEPKLSFWKGSAHLGFLHQHQSVSLNIVDAALNVCNNLPFEKRVTQAFQRSLWNELLLKYLNHDTVEQTVLGQLQPQLAAEMA